MQFLVNIRLNYFAPCEFDMFCMRLFFSGAVCLVLQKVKVKIQMSWRRNKCVTSVILENILFKTKYSAQISASSITNTMCHIKKIGCLSR